METNKCKDCKHIYVANFEQDVPLPYRLFCQKFHCDYLFDGYDPYTGDFYEPLPPYLAISKVRGNFLLCPHFNEGKTI